MIEAIGVSRRIGSKVLLERVDLQVEAGTVLALVGPNGAGKSTLLKILSGELEPSSGQVLLAGEPIGSLAPRRRARLRAVLPQDSSVAFPLSAYDVVLLGRTPHEGAGETLRDRTIARLAMSLTDTLALAERSFPTLSGGERQRVQTARVIAQIWENGEPRALFLDEPTSSLDVAHQHATLEQARRMAGEGCAVVCVLHDLNLAAQYADRVAVLSRGVLRADGPPSRVLEPSLLEEVFDVRALVVPHPELTCPLVVPIGPTTRRTATACVIDGGL
ncbi:Heme ABC transporter, ATPase component HmuV [Labilithrix luteola]|uniref:Heme ABC transporter, ATPase component HmuV n=1 Tax=Labilithrix luteola TaxID=1391654 RepID=A0A0K1QAI8_9BACT|nr:heme ABC transporter ATP-binding protein [Labilithrix luteola]AKV02801.1 Heme ABC transporter, ATPase component HmuV [Labilithrix luteola]